MKKMDDVFYLPVLAEDCCGEPHLSDEYFFFANFEDELNYSDGNGLLRAQHAARAINHVDALADALENLLLHAEKGVSNIVLNKAARSVLEAYRGEA